MRSLFRRMLRFFSLPNTQASHRRVVLDTNILVAAGYAPGSTSAQIVQACLRGELVPVISTELEREYDCILPRACRRPGWREWYARLKRCAARVHCNPAAHPVPGDPDDSVVLATAVAGNATIVSNDAEHLHPMDGHCGVGVVTAGAFWSQQESDCACR